MSAAREERRAVIAVSVQTVLAIASFFVAKETVHSVPAAAVVLVRGTGAAIVLGALSLARRDPAAKKIGRTDLLVLAVLGICGVPLNQGLFLEGMSLTSAAHAALLYALTPAVVLGIGRLRGMETLTRPRLAGIVLALAGVSLVLLDRTRATANLPDSLAAHQTPTDTLRGDLCILGAMLSWAAYTALARNVIRRVGALRATAGSLGFGAAIYLPLGLVLSRHVDPASIPPMAWAGIAWMILISSAVSYLCWYYAIERLEPSRVAIFNNLQPIGTALGSWLLFGVPLGPFAVAGGVFAVAGVALVQRERLLAQR